MKLLLIFLILILFTGAGFCTAPTVFSDWDILRSSRCDGGAHSYMYYSGNDTLANAEDDSCGYDSTFTTGYLQVAWSDTVIDAELTDKVAGKIAQHRPGAHGYRGGGTVSATDY